MPLTNQQRIIILMMRGYGDKTRSYDEVAHLFNDTFPDLPPIAKTTVMRTVNRFEETGSVKDKPRSGRPKSSTADDQSLDVLLSVREDPHISTRKLAQTSGISRSSIRRILKHGSYHPFKMRLVQELLEDDFDRRMQFCEEMMARYDANNLVLFWTCFGDESTFHLNGQVNRHNMHYWCDLNPFWMKDNHTQFDAKVNVWAGILNNKIIGPFFINETLTAERYLNLLRDKIIPRIREVVGDAFDNVWFQQDGAQPHFGLVVRNYLNETFPGRWIGRRGAVEWPARSPDMTPLDFFYWGYLKSKVYETRPANIEDLKQRILSISETITPETLANVTEEVYLRLGHCQAVEGKQFEHLIK